MKPSLSLTAGRAVGVPRLSSPLDPGSLRPGGGVTRPSKDATHKPVQREQFMMDTSFHLPLVWVRTPSVVYPSLSDRLDLLPRVFVPTPVDPVVLP